MSWIKESVPVDVVGGSYKGNHGTIVHCTPKKVRLQFDDGTTTGLISKGSVARAKATSRLTSTKKKPPPKMAGRASAKSKPAQLELPSVSPMTPPRRALNIKDDPHGPPVFSLEKENVVTEPDLKHSADMAAAFVEPIIVSDPSVLMGIGLIATEAISSGLSLPTLIAITYFSAVRIYSAPPRSPMSDWDWMSVNWTLTAGAVAIWDGIHSGRDLENIDWWSLQLNDLDEELKAQLLSVVTCFAVAVTCTLSYRTRLFASNKQVNFTIISSLMVINRVGLAVYGVAKSPLFGLLQTLRYSHDLVKFLLFAFGTAMVSLNCLTVLL